MGGIEENVKQKRDILLEEGVGGHVLPKISTLAKKGGGLRKGSKLQKIYKGGGSVKRVIGPKEGGVQTPLRTMIKKYNHRCPHIRRFQSHHLPRPSSIKILKSR